MRWPTTRRRAAGHGPHCAALGAPDAATGLFDLARELGAPTALRDIGMPQDGLLRVLELALSNPYWNPRPLEAMH
jgi:maleylacetate reductase